MFITKFAAGLFFLAVIASPVLGGYLNDNELHRINNATSDWKANIPTVFANSSLADLKKLGAANPPATKPAFGDVPQDEMDVKRLLQAPPTSFDARTKWSSCIGPVRLQGECGACWAISEAEIFEDRLCIAGKVSPLVQRSAQFMLDCDTNQLGCNGGTPSSAWTFLTIYGAPTETCYPYTGKQGKCQTTCKDGSKLTTRKVASVLSYSTINDVKNDIMTRGPVETYFSLYSDIYYYQSGIYSPTTTEFAGYHAVKVVGWGVDAKAGNYWIVQNSWGTSWGENGFFRIKASQGTGANKYTTDFDIVSHFIAGTV